GNRREPGGQHPPPAQGAAGQSAIETGKFEASDAQSRSARAVDDKQILVGRPEQTGDSNHKAQSLNLRRTHRRQLPEYETKKSGITGEEQAIDQGGHAARAKFAA